MATAFVMLAFTFPLWCSCRLDTLHHQYLTLTLPSVLTSCLKLLSLCVLDPSLRKWQQNFTWHQDVGTAVPANILVQHRQHGLPPGRGDGSSPAPKKHSLLPAIGSWAQSSSASTCESCSSEETTGWEKLPVSSQCEQILSGRCWVLASQFPECWLAENYFPNIFTFKVTLQESDWSGIIKPLPSCPSHCLSFPISQWLRCGWMTGKLSHCVPFTGGVSSLSKRATRSPGCSWGWFITELSPARKRWKRCRQRKGRRNDSIFPFSQSKNKQNLPLFLKPTDGASSFGSHDKCPEASEYLGYKNRITACQNLSIFWIFCPKQQKIE